MKIVENDDFDAESAAQKLKDAMQGCGKYTVHWIYV